MEITANRNVGRWIGLLLLVHLASGLIVPYVLLRPLNVTPGAFLETAAGMALSIRLNVLVLLAGAAIPVGIAIAAWPLARQDRHALGLALLVLAAVNLSLAIVENAQWLSMLSLSQAYADRSAADTGVFPSLAIVVRSAWKWAHYSHILIVVAWIFVLFFWLFRGALIPRALSAAGLLTAMMQVGGITLPVFLGYRMPFPELFGMPLGLVYLATSSWLMFKGFPRGRATAA